MNIVYAMGIGFLLDCVLGDPHALPHPVRWIGSLISLLDGQLHLKRGFSRKIQFFCGALLVFAVLAATGAAAFGVRYMAYRLHGMAGIAADSILFYYCIAPHSLYRESMAVRTALQETGRLQEARQKLSMIVGRDTEKLTQEGIIKAAVETVAENTSDGVTAPMLYMALGGPVLCFLYRAVNTMDSMVGYKNERYLYFGRAAAKLDDLVNYIPARVSAWLMICGAFLLGKEFSGSGAIRIYWRDRRKHASPNSAHTESVCAGALGVRLAGDGRYFGKLVRKPFIGDGLREVECEDIRRANGLMGAAGWICWGICVGVILVRDGGIFCW